MNTNQHKTEFLYGLHPLQALLEYRPEQVKELAVRKGKRSSAQEALVAQARTAGIKVAEVSADQLNRNTGNGVHQGVMAEAEQRPDLGDTELEQVLANSSELLFLILDSVEDPRNLGACLRVADGAGVDGVIIARSRGARLTPLVAKVASGAAESVPCYRVANLARTLKFMADVGVQLVGAADEGADSLYDLKPEQITALVIGHEGSGLRHLTRQHCSELVAIPMLGTVESLNLSVAAGVMLYEIQRKRLKLNVNNC
ncbi:MAG: 23S rRNA (guanosine(2251)-2'-O)-methyltransferase RlmB [Immundisolibacteraceae bacterium]|nr:23S rRNA (guanosine(2251)-2'-O)-methyltransferase RlmB [Immundisolibacteraceae bacterium]